MWNLQKQKDANILRGQNWAPPQHCNTTDAPDWFVKHSQQHFIQQNSFSSFASNRLKCLFDADVSHSTLRYYISSVLVHHRPLWPSSHATSQTNCLSTAIQILQTWALSGTRTTEPSTVCQWRRVLPPPPWSSSTWSSPVCEAALNSEPLLEKMSHWPWIKVLEWFVSNLSHTICHRPARRGTCSINLIIQQVLSLECWRRIKEIKNIRNP